MTGGDARAAVGHDRRAGVMPACAKRALRRSGVAMRPAASRCSRVGTLRAPGMCPERGSTGSGAPPAKRSASRASISTLVVVATSSMLVSSSRGHGTGVKVAGGRGRGSPGVQVLRRPGGEPAVEQRRLVSDRAQHPHQPRRDHAAGVVVGDDGVAVSDPEPGEPAGETLGRRPAGAGRRGRRRAAPTAPCRGPRTRLRGCARPRTRRAPSGRPGTSARRRRSPRFAVGAEPVGAHERVDHPRDSTRLGAGRCVRNPPPRGISDTRRSASGPLGTMPNSCQ